MSAAIFARLLDEFRAGWLSIGGHPFVLEFASAQFGDAVDPSFGRRGCTYQYLGSACLPVDDTRDALLAWAIVRSDPETAQGIEDFGNLCSEAGAHIPSAIRDWVGDYHWPSDTDPASWWIAILAKFFRIPGTGINASYLQRPKLIDPWLMSLDVIEKLRLHTDSPCRPVEASNMQSTNDARDAWLYECKRERMTHTAIRVALRQEHPEWDGLESDQAVGKAIDRYCERKKLPLIRRKSE